MRILMTHQYAWPEVRRGTERYLHELAGALTDAGHDVSIRTTAPSAARYVVRGAEVRAWQRRLTDRRFGPTSEGVLFAARALAHAVPRRFDVWHANGAVDGAAAAVWSRLPGAGRSVFTDHGFPAARSRKNLSDRAFFEHVVRHVDTYLCVSEAAAHYLRTDYGREPAVRSGGIDTRVFSPGGARAPGRVVLFVGDADEERKGAASLVAAAAGTGAQTWIAGPGDQAAALARSGASGSDVRLLGVVDPDELVQLYRQATVTALPARAEAFGLVLVESLACGTPVVALDEGGPSEIVTPDVGVLAGSGDADVLREALLAAFDLAATRGIAETCRARAMAWDWRRAVVPDVVRLYEAGR